MRSLLHRKAAGSPAGCRSLKVIVIFEWPLAALVQKSHSDCSSSECSHIYIYNPDIPIGLRLIVPDIATLPRRGPKWPSGDESVINKPSLHTSDDAQQDLQSM